MLRVLAREWLQSWTPGVSLGREGGIDKRVGGQGLWREMFESEHCVVSHREERCGQTELSWGVMGSGCGHGKGPLGHC